MGVVGLRLARFGRKNLPFYRIFAADSRSPRDGKHLEVLGHYNPLPGKDGMKRIGINSDRVKYWLSVGAQPSDTVAKLLHKAGILPPPPIPRVKPKREDAESSAGSAKCSRIQLESGNGLSCSVRAISIPHEV